MLEYWKIKKSVAKLRVRKTKSNGEIERNPKIV
jgi:hypothetical protein